MAFLQIVVVALAVASVSAQQQFATNYNAGDSARTEQVLPDGSVRGQYSYQDASGKLVTVKYTAGKDGYKAESDALPQAPNARPQHQQQPFYNPQQQQPFFNQQPQQNYYQPQQYQPAPQYNTQPQYNTVPASGGCNPADGDYCPNLINYNQAVAPIQQAQPQQQHQQQPFQNFNNFNQQPAQHNFNQQPAHQGACNPNDGDYCPHLVNYGPTSK